ncbi:MAG: ATP-binding protein [Candidatus Aminicenantes bacterium]|jgi:heavy metal sensor kinase
MKIKRVRSLSFKLTVWYIVILGIIVILAGVFLFQGFKDSLMQDLDQTLLEIANDTSEKWMKTRGLTWEGAIKKGEDKFSSYNPFIQLVEISDEEKKQIVQIIRSDRIPEGVFRLDAKLYCRADKSDIDNLIFMTMDEERLSSYPLRVFLLPVRGPRILQVGIPLEKTLGALNRLLIVMVLAGAIIMLLASVGGSLIINRALHPVKSVVKTAKKITADDLSLRIDTKHRKDEIGALVETFNGMISRLEKSVKKIRQFSGDVSHELRTPLTIIRGEIEVLLRKDRPKEEYLSTLNSVLEESQRMEKLIDDLLFLSRVEALDRSKFTTVVQLEEILKLAIESRRPSATKKNLILKAEKIEPAKIRGNMDLLERMVANIIDNAIRYTPEGGTVEAVLVKGQDNVRLEIRDTGIGIPEESLSHIFDRFYVVDKSRSKETGGAGLGLSIVKWIAENHNAKIHVQSRLNQGTNFVITFPSA